MKITFRTPQSVSELLLYFEEIKFLHYFVPYRMTTKDVRAFIENVAPDFTLVYLNDVLPIGCFILHAVQGESKKSLELHGIARPDLKSLIGRKASRAVLDAVYKRIFDRVFNVLGKERIIAKVYPDAKGALFFVRRFGFTRVPNMDKGRQVWKLERKTYLDLCPPEVRE